MIFLQNIPVRVNTVLDGVEIDEYLIIDSNMLPYQIVELLTEAYGISEQASNRLFEIIIPQLQFQPLVLQNPTPIKLNITYKNLNFTQIFSLDPENFSPYSIADNLITDFSLATTIEEYGIWSKLIAFNILSNLISGPPDVQPPYGVAILQ